MSYDYSIYNDRDDYNPEDYDYRSEFADPGGNSSLYAETRTNLRNLPCPTCGAENVLTPRDRDARHQCNACADRVERGWDY